MLKEQFDKVYIHTCRKLCTMHDKRCSWLMQIIYLDMVLRYGTHTCMKIDDNNMVAHHSTQRMEKRVIFS